MAQRPVMLVILDGWGWREGGADNAVHLAATPNFDRLMREHPHALLRTSGEDVGLPEGQIGNSEVGHLNIGAGRVVRQELPRISAAIADGSLGTLPALTRLIDALKRSEGTCHLIGLVSTGGVHSHLGHCAALARHLVQAGVLVQVHAIMDGRDTLPQSGAEHLQTLLAALPDDVGIGTVCGRYYAMDRDHRWDRVEKAYAALALGQGAHFTDAAAAIADAYAANLTDEFISPSVIEGFSAMQDGDGLLCFNFRADRVRELLAALLDPDFSGFARPRRPQFAAAVGMTSYSTELAERLETLFPPQPMENLLGEVVAAAGLRQLRMAETEKYAHVTYFFNGGKETPNPGEQRILVPSPQVATYDLQPEMSAPELTDRAVAAIVSGSYDLIVLNYANPDMVGHTGSLEATIRAVEAADAGLGRLADAVAQAGGALLVTADHGNAEMMRDPQGGGPHPAHTTNPVPVVLAGGPGDGLRDGRLADIAPTLLALLGLPQPAEMTGHPLLPGDAAA
ncbi:MAG: 2,3-bisphosphoglycerate-independent phosphoglycerate mutase [Acidisphaera sp.]|nr:2,3-bisphosphoglycerate-independent phosphoglycerate mutase [Acidisphaera sp.]